MTGLISFLPDREIHQIFKLNNKKINPNSTQGTSIYFYEPF